MSESRIFEIPFISGGREYSSRDNSVSGGTVLEYDQGNLEVRFPALSVTDVEEIISISNDQTALSIDEILDFLAEVGKLWSDPEYIRYRNAFNAMTQITDFSREELALDFSYIPSLLERGGYLEEMLRSEFGDPEILDNWIVRGACEVKAIPRGRLLHILAGNVPGVELISLARGLMTKNANILKMARGNPITPVALVQSFADVDPQHPITRNTSVIYWERGSLIESSIYRQVQSACVWGGYDAVQAAWSNSRPGLEILEYGPKRSMVFVGAESISTPESTAAVASALASDTVIHDQQACHSPQVVFVEGDAEMFSEALGRALTNAGEGLPRGTDSIDRKTQIGHMRNMAELMGEHVYHPGSTAWTLIVTDDFTRTVSNPLGRTLWILSVETLDTAVRFADSWTMVAAFSRREDLEIHRDFLASMGVDRITTIGNMGLLPPGTPHEGRYDLTRLVKFVSSDLYPAPYEFEGSRAESTEFAV